jgi:hypothetical protein
MIPLLKDLWYRFRYDPLFVRRWGRAALMAVAGSGLAFGDQLAAVLDAPGAVKAVKIVAIVAGLLSVAITAGERNRPAEP